MARAAGPLRPWHTVYMRLNRWAKRGVLERVWAELMRERLLEGGPAAASLDSTIIKLHPDGAGAPKKGRGRSGARAAAGRPSCTCWRSMTAAP